MPKNSRKPRNFEYDVALSFAGEDRPYVEQVSSELQKRGIKHFYDKIEEIDLWGKDLYEHFTEIYREKARYCVIFISKHYAKKEWTKLERRSAQSRSLEEQEEYILPARFDDTQVPGILPTTQYVDLTKISPAELCERIIKKLSHP